MKISVCIPTYEANGKGVFFVKKLIESILKQTYQNYEIIISDHSTNDEIQNYVCSLSNHNVFYYRNGEYIGKPAYNTNNAINKSSGDYVKIMNMDDYFECENTLKSLIECINETHKWSLCGFKHFNYNSSQFENPMIPKIVGDGIHLVHGLNYVGCPSVGLFPKGEIFDTSVEYMIDCELWFRLFTKLGAPCVVDDYKIIIGTGNHSLTNQMRVSQNTLLQKDINYCKLKYNI